MDPPNPPTRRDVLTYSTFGVGLVTVGAAVNGLFGAIKDHVPSPEKMIIDISGIAEGTEISVKFEGRPYVVRYRTASEIAAAVADDGMDFPDPFARNPNLTDNAPASDQNRRANPDGRFIVLSKVCPHLGCIVMGTSGDYGGYFCPCHGAHFDTSGRVRKGPPPRNLEIPSYTMPDDATLVLLSGATLSERKRDVLIYGSPQD